MGEHKEFQRLQSEAQLAPYADEYETATLTLMALIKIGNQLERLVNLAEAASKEGGEE